MAAASTLAEVIAKFPPEILQKFDFSNARYTGALEHITGIVCPEHGEFKQYAAYMRKTGRGCAACGDESRKYAKRLSQEEFVAKATALHNGYYSYERAVYNGNKKKVTVTCPKHGDFSILALNHMNTGQGCAKCGAAKRGRRKDPKSAGRKTADAKIEKFAGVFLERARKIHGDAYDYSSMIYKGMRTKIVIMCPRHGPFEQTPGHHLMRSHGCPECSHHRSKGEADIVKFLSIFTEVQGRRRDLIGKQELDIYLPEHKLAVEYCGEYWHAARTLDDEKRDRWRHLRKLQDCEAAGIRLLTVYGTEWDSRPWAIKHLLRNAIGAGRGRVMARKCDVRPVGRAAAEFFDKYHPQGGSGHGIHIGLFYKDVLVACMRFTFGANDRGAGSERVWTLSRYATRFAVPGGASRLLKAFIDKYDPPLIKSFSDRRYFTGGMYERLGFELEEELGPDYQVYDQRTKPKLKPKSAWQRKNIPARIREIGSSETFDPDLDDRSEAKMTYILGARRIFDCGKKRWIWRKPQT